MKKLILFQLTLLTLLLSACSNTTVVTEAPVGGQRFSGMNVDSITIVTDSETGCEYLYIVDGNGTGRTSGLSPLMGKDGLAECN